MKRWKNWAPNFVCKYDGEDLVPGKEIQGLVARKFKHDLNLAILNLVAIFEVSRKMIQPMFSLKVKYFSLVKCYPSIFNRLQQCVTSKV